MVAAQQIPSRAVVNAIVKLNWVGSIPELAKAASAIAIRNA